MNIIYADIDWWVHTDNEPVLRVLVNSREKDLIYKAYKVRDNTLYLAQDHGYCNFLYHMPRNERGYGGQVFTIKVYDPYADDVYTVNVPGPWSSNAEAVYEITGVRCVPVHMTDKLQVFQKGHTFQLGYFTYDVVMNYVRENMPNITLQNGSPRRIAANILYGLPKIDFHLAFAYYENPEAESNWYIERHFDKYYTSDWKEVFKKRFSEN